MIFNVIYDNELALKQKLLSQQSKANVTFKLIFTKNSNNPQLKLWEKYKKCYKKEAKTLIMSKTILLSIKLKFKCQIFRKYVTNYTLDIWSSKKNDNKQKINNLRDLQKNKTVINYD